MRIYTNNYVVYLVINNILQSNPKLIIEIVEEVLFIHESHSADLINCCLGCCAHVLEVCSDSDGKFATKLFPPEARDRHVFPLGSNHNIHSSCVDWMIQRLD